MKQRLYYILLVAVMTACEVDNYDAPDATLTGTVKDVITGKGLITESGGFSIRYRQINPIYPDAPNRSFAGKADGTYNYTKLFADSYDVNPINGAFVAIDPQRVTVSSGQSTTLDFTVTPYVSFENVSIVKKGADGITATFTLKKNAGSIQDYRILATNKTPLVGINTNDVGGDAVDLTEAEVGSPISVDRTGFETGGSYWIRIGARCNEAASHYNLTEVFEIKF
jgi:hypothetical protein